MKRTFILKTFPILLGFLFSFSTIWGQVFVENFDYTIGSLLTENGWTAHSGAGTQPITVTNGLSFNGYIGSDIGGSALLDNNGEDAHRTFETQSSGVVYTAFMVNVQTTAAGYFLHLGGNPIGTTFRGKVFMDASNHFGVSVGANTATYATNTFSNGATYFLVLKYEIVDGASNNIVSLYVFDGAFPTSEPAVPTIGPLTDGAMSDIDPAAIGLRQFVATENITVDGIRIASNWADAATPSGGPVAVATPTFNPAPGNVTEPFDLTILCSTENADIYYTLDGTDPDETSTPFTNAIPISVNTTVKARAYAEGLEPSSIATAVYAFPTTVATLAELRTGTIGNTYLITGEVWLTFQQTFRGNKFFQDATAGILIDDPTGIITSDFEIGDGVIGLYGVLGEFGGMMQLVPASDPGDPISSGNFPEPQVITIDELFSNFEEYESELVRLNDITFADGGGTFANGIVYPISDASDASGDFRTTFYDIDYIGTAIPNIQLDIVGLPNSRVTEGNLITSRSLDDFYLGILVDTPTFDPPAGAYETPIEVEILCTTPDAEIYYTTDGSDPDQTSTPFIDPIAISQTTTLKARAYLAGIDPSLIATAQYNFAETVANLAELRAGVMGNTYTVTGEVILTYQQTNRKQKFIQDATGAVLIDDPDGIITTTYAIGDGITGLSGVLAEYGGMIEFVPNADPGAPTSSGNFPTPQVVTLGELFTNFEAYESELVKIESATFADGGATFATGAVYGISDESDAAGNFRTSFYDADYIGTTVPIPPTDIIGIPNSRPEGEYITSRSSADLIVNVVPPAIVVLSPNGGETWEQGKTYNITWANVNFTGNVNVNITKLPFTNISLAANIANTGTWSWTIPVAFATGDYKIKITGVTPGDPFDSSDGTFAISEPLPDPKIVINEIMYNPATALGNDADYEYLEIYNNSGFAVDLSNWTIAQAITYTFAEGTTLANNNYLVIALKPDSIITHYNISNVVGPFSGGLNNTGEPVELKDAAGVTMDLVTYADSGEWPTEPDGFGPSLELLDPDLDNSLPANWAASIVNDGTPGTQNSVFGAEFLTLVAPNGGETLEQGSSQQISWTHFGFSGDLMIKLIDVVLEDTTTLASNVPVTSGLWDWEIPGDLAAGENYKIMIAEMADGLPMDESDGVFSVVAVIVPTITVISPNGGEAWAQGTTHEITWISEFFTGDVKIELSDATDVLTLLGENIPVATGTFTWNIPAELLAGDTYTVLVSGMLSGDPSDASDAAFSVVEPQPFPDVVINEISYNPPEAGTDTLEYIELYNNSTFTVNLQNWTFSQGVELVFPNYELGAGEYLITAYRADVMLNEFGIVALQWTGGGLSNSGETIELLNDSGEQVDIVTFDDAGTWPVAPDGYGPSLSLVDPSLDNGMGENWKSETAFAFDHPVGIPVFATPGAINLPVPAQSMLVSSGWSGVSTYTSLSTPALADNMAMVLNDLTLVQDFSHLYFPQYGINTIGDWNTDKGYQLKLENTRYLVLYGEMALDKSVALTAGWNGLPVLSDCPVDAVSLFGGVTEVIFVKEMGSEKVYWPDGSLFTLDFLTPGNAYFIKVSADVNITFPACAGKFNPGSEKSTFINNTEWNNVAPTAASHAVGIAASAMADFAEGDMIGAFTQDGYCAGMATISKQNQMLMVWADDIYTDRTDGFVEGALMNFRLYSTLTGEVSEIIPEFDNSFGDAGEFTGFGISFITSFKAGANGIGEENTVSLRLYPNPANEDLNITMAGNAFDHFEIFSAVGQKVLEDDVNDDLFQINLNALEKGFYFIKFVNSMNGNQQSLSFIKN